jgi:transcriptional regulator with XRE-family HTH domain
MLVLDRLAMVRDRAFMTQQELADASGVSRSSIAKLETYVRPASAAAARKLAAALGVAPRDLVSADETTGDLLRVLAGFFLMARRGETLEWTPAELARTRRLLAEASIKGMAASVVDPDRMVEIGGLASTVLAWFEGQETGRAADDRDAIAELLDRLPAA